MAYKIQRLVIKVPPQDELCSNTCLQRDQRASSGIQKCTVMRVDVKVLGGYWYQSFGSELEEGSEATPLYMYTGGRRRLSMRLISLARIHTLSNTGTKFSTLPICQIQMQIILLPNPSSSHLKRRPPTYHMPPLPSNM